MGENDGGWGIDNIIVTGGIDREVDDTLSIRGRLRDWGGAVVLCFARIVDENERKRGGNMTFFEISRQDVCHARTHSSDYR